MSAYLQHSINCKGRLIDLSKPVVMGILNTTPDSFFDGGRYDSLSYAVEQTGRMIEEGAAIIDIGGYSSRPGADEVPVEEELKRTIPFIEELCRIYPEIIISIDTFRAEVARQAVKAGASIVNDISAGDDDSEMIATVAALQVPYIFMHKQGNPKTMQDQPAYESVVDEVFEYLAKKKQDCLHAGIKDIIADPGFGFGKTIDHNFQLLKHLPHFYLLEIPVLVGVSRKSMIKNILDVSAEESLNGSTVLHTIALTSGCHILRVHDVKEAKEAITLVNRLHSVD